MISHWENGGEATRMTAAEPLTKSVHSPFGVQIFYTLRGEAPFADGMDEWIARIGCDIKSVLLLHYTF